MDRVPNSENFQALIQQRHSTVDSRSRDLFHRPSSSAMVTQFLNSGGTVPEVVKVVLDFALNQDEDFGDGEFMAVFRDEVEAMPECANDGDFDAIRPLTA